MNIPLSELMLIHQSLQKAIRREDIPLDARLELADSSGRLNFYVKAIAKTVNVEVAQ